MLTGSSDSGLAKEIARAVDAKSDDRKWVRASMGVMSYEHEMRVLNHELADKNATIEQQQAELDSLRTLLAKLLAGEKIDPDAALLESLEPARAPASEPRQAE